MSDVKRWDHSDDEMWEHEVHGRYVLASDYYSLLAQIASLREALEWVAQHPYAGGKSFGDTPIVRAALKQVTP